VKRRYGNGSLPRLHLVDNEIALSYLLITADVNRSLIKVVGTGILKDNSMITIERQHGQIGASAYFAWAKDIP
jgi:hypothetical protein